MKFNRNQSTLWLGHFGLMLEYFQAYWLRVKIFFNTLAQD
jgi:hypothetical protein